MGRLRAQVPLLVVLPLIFGGLAWADFYAVVTIDQASIQPTTVEPGGCLTVSLDFTVDVLQYPTEPVNYVWDRWQIYLDGNSRISGATLHPLTQPTMSHSLVKELMIPLNAAPGIHTVTFRCGTGYSQWDFETSVDRTFTVTPDTTPPTTQLAADPSTLWPPNGESRTVTFSGQVTDDNPVGLQAWLDIFDEYGGTDPLYSFDLTGEGLLGRDGSFSVSVSLIADREKKDRDGRVYTGILTASDAAGNAASATADVTVARPLRGKKSK